MRVRLNTDNVRSTKTRLCVSEVFFGVDANVGRTLNAFCVNAILRVIYFSGTYLLREPYLDRTIYNKADLIQLIR